MVLSHFAWGEEYMKSLAKLLPSRAVVLAVLVSANCVLCPRNSAAQIGTWLTHSHDRQHTAVSSVPSQPFSKIHWRVPVDLNPPTGEIFIHYGSPLVTAANTVIVPVKTGFNGFLVEQPGHAVRAAAMQPAMR